MLTNNNLTEMLITFLQVCNTTWPEYRIEIVIDNIMMRWDNIDSFETNLRLIVYWIVTLNVKQTLQRLIEQS